jgi:KaiC/GvpD/RAD55 family RecA-like ATPase
MKMISSGILGLDEMVGGGFPENRIILVRGGPGAGKTVFSLQFLVEGAKKGEQGIYVTLEEPMTLIKSNMKPFGWDLEGFERRGLMKLIDESGQVYKPFTPNRYDRDSIKLLITPTLGRIKQEVEKFETKRLVIDPITSFVINRRFPTDKRLEIIELIKALRKLQCTVVITSEAVSHLPEKDFFVEEYLADGAVILSKRLRGFNVIKTVRIEKMRGVKHDDQPRRYKIGDNGIEVYNTEQVII